MNRGNSTHNVEALFDLKNFNNNEHPAYQLADLLGLVNYQWVSSDHMDEDELDESVIYVD